MSFNQAMIQAQLSQGQVLVFSEIDSTNNYLLNHHQQFASGTVCIAEQQTAGRGRRGRSWHSPRSQNLYFSLLWHYPRIEIPQLSAFSLVCALVVAETFQQLGVQDIQIKWPNDIYYQGKKMGGILIENSVDRTGLHLVIGIGLNLGMQDIEAGAITQQWSDLASYQLDRNRLVSLLANQLQQALANYSQTSFAPYQSRWQQWDIFDQQAVKLVTEFAEIHGIACGVNQNGELLLKQGEQIQTFAIGEISLRAEL